MIVNCDLCAARGPACGDCVITSLLGPPDWLAVDGLPGEEVAALAVLASSGLVPPLRLIPCGPDPASARPRPQAGQAVWTASQNDLGPVTSGCRGGGGEVAAEGVTVAHRCS